MHTLISYDWCPYKKRRRDTDRERTCEDRGRDWHDVATSCTDGLSSIPHLIFLQRKRRSHLLLQYIIGESRKRNSTCSTRLHPPSVFLNCLKECIVCASLCLIFSVASCSSRIRPIVGPLCQ